MKTTNHPQCASWTRNRYHGSYSLQASPLVASIVPIERRFAGAFEVTVYDNSGQGYRTNGTLRDCKAAAEMFIMEHTA